MIGLNAVVDLYRPTGSVNAYGEDVQTLPTGATYDAMRCRWTNLSSADAERVTYQLGNQSEVAHFRVFFEPDKDVKVFDRLKKGADYHRVLAVVNVHEMGHHLEVYTAKAEGVT